MEKTGRIVKGVGGQYQVRYNDGKTEGASVRGIFRKDGLKPTVGDIVRCVPSGDQDIPWRIEHIEPRKTYLVRPPVANLDALVITLSAADPEPDLFLADKLITVCLVNGIEPLIILTKTDLAADASAVLDDYRQTGCRLLETAPHDTESLVVLRQWIAGRMVSFAGQSGVGKSTLLNRLFDAEMMPSGDLSAKLGRGRHTTRHVELFSIDGGFLADTPGFSQLELKDLGIDGDQLETGYPEIQSVSPNCRFTGCRHLGELGCAVPDSPIPEGRLERYRTFRKQLDSFDPYTGKTIRSK